jgi:exosortase
VWPHTLAAALVLAAFVPFFTTLAHVASRNPYAGHVILVPIFASALIWVERRRLRALAGDGTALGAAVTGAALGLLGLGYATASVPLQVLSLVGAVAGMAMWRSGVGGLRRVAFALAFLLLMIPPPRDVVAAVSPAVQHLVADFSRVVLDGLHIPVEQQGTFLRLPGLTLEVAEECNGLRFLAILVVLVAAFARVVLPTAAGQVLLTALAIPVGILANAMRVAATGVGAHLIGPSVASGPVHYWVGKSFWALAILTMIGVAIRLRARGERVAAHGRSRGHCVAGTP